MTMLVADTDEPRHLRELTQEKASLPRRAMSPKRHLTMPVMPGENLTDSEAMPVSPRLRSRSKGNESPHYFQDLAVPPSTSTMNGFFTPTRPQGKRRQSTRPRLNIPPPITQHFAHGWPHAGSWQDALYGYYDEDPNSGPSRKGSGEGAQKKASRKRFVTREASELESAPVSTASPARPKRIRTRSRRTKRYRQALTPPTPAGLGFVTSGEGWKEGRVGGQGFDWNAASRQEPSMDIEEEDGLSRSETRATSNMNEKGKVESPAKKQPWWRIMRGRQQKPIRKVEEVEWRKRMRRILFLDARLTIWIRAFNLAVVIVLLGTLKRELLAISHPYMPSALAIIIRLDLSKLHLPGLIGSSTTLIIIYSCPTILHVLTAIYREYFGKPIGLWGLRSKMLWVCLDLLFVALWSSAMSSATNDYIGTPLECTPGSPWWRGGLGEECAELLAEKQLLNSTSAPDEMAVTSISMISHPLGFVLPAEVLLLQSGVVHEICRRQAGCIALALVALSLYGGNMVLSLFRIFETVRRTANMGKAVNT